MAEAFYPCISCKLNVRPRQHAITCDVCNRCQHRKCNAAISFKEYQDARKGKTTINFKCEEYAVEPDISEDPWDNEENAKEPDINEGPRDNEENAEEPDISEDPWEHLDSSNNPLDVSFDLPHRNVQGNPETLETSVTEQELPDEVPAEEEVTYQILPTGSQRGTPLLVSSSGYTYVIRNTKGNKTHWRCSVRSKNNSCKVTVCQDDVDTFTTNNETHSHPADPSIKEKKKA